MSIEILEKAPSSLELVELGSNIFLC